MTATFRERPRTDEERAILVSHLRTLGTSQGLETCLDAANEIEWLCELKLPDVSAGLIEAAEIAEKIADDDDEIEPWAVRFFLCSFAKFLRARAADRSGK